MPASVESHISWKPSTTFGANLPIRKWKRSSGPNGESNPMCACSSSTATDAVGVLAEGHFAQVRHVIAERAGAEDVHLLWELKVVADRA